MSFLKDLAAYLEPRDYGPGDVVCARGELNRVSQVLFNLLKRISPADDLLVFQANKRPSKT